MTTIQLLVETRARRAVAARGSRGMTLIEIIVVVAIISLVLGGVGVMAINQLNQARLDTAKNDTVQIQQAVEIYMAQKRNKCPKTLQDLKAAGVASKVTKDPWGNDYVLKCPGENLSVDVMSGGPDGQVGTDDDISNFMDEADDDAKVGGAGNKPKKN